MQRAGWGGLVTGLTLLAGGLACALTNGLGPAPPAPDLPPVPTSTQPVESSPIAVQATATPKTAEVVPEPARVVRPGDLAGRVVFTRNATQPDINGNEILLLDLATGAQTQLTDNQVPDWIPGWSPDGSAIVFTSYRSDNYDIWTMNVDGSEPSSRVASPAWDDYPVWSPDGTQFAFSSTGVTGGVHNSEIFVGSSDGDMRQVTFNSGKDEWPDWSPNGEWLASSSDRDGDMDIYIYRADGGGTVTQLTDDPGRDEQPEWSPDGGWIVFQRKSVDHNGDGTIDEHDGYGDLWLGRRDGSEVRQLTLDGLAAHPTWSPDGAHILFSHYRDSNGDGQFSPADGSDLWVLAVGGGEPRVLTSGLEHDWAADWGP